jgi:short-subunit dehydrogenase
MSTVLPKALITGASTGIGAAYADRFARRGHDLVLVARDESRMRALAARLEKETTAKLEVLRADLTDAAQLARVEDRLREDERIGVLVNNAGLATHGTFAAPDVEATDQLIRLNITAVTRLTEAVIPRYLRQGGGAIINIASVLAVAPEYPLGAYPATKAYVLSLSQGVSAELGSRGVYVQAVLPAATRTEIWERSGRDVNSLQNVMDVDALVDAALVGFDRHETVTFPPLSDEKHWEAFEGARKNVLAHAFNARPGTRYTHG